MPRRRVEGSRGKRRLSALRAHDAAESGTRHIAAERAVRKGVLWRKGSFGSHSAEGSRLAERMLTVSESLRAQGRSILEFVERSIRAALGPGARPSLLPVSDA